MKCASCGEKIKGDPVWKDDEPYCSEECADMGPFEEEEEDEEEEEEKQHLLTLKTKGRQFFPKEQMLLYGGFCD